MVRHATTAVVLQQPNRATHVQRGCWLQLPVLLLYGRWAPVMPQQNRAKQLCTCSNSSRSSITNSSGMSWGIERGVTDTSNNNRKHMSSSAPAAPLYSFFLPLAALSWSRRQHFWPIILLVEDVPHSKSWGSNKPSAVILKYLHMWGFGDSVYPLRHDARLPENNVAISQVARVYAASLCGLQGPLAAAVEDNAYIVTTDADIVPVADASYLLPSNESVTGKVTNAFCCDYITVRGQQCRQLPISTITMRASTWQELVGGCICNKQEPHLCLNSTAPAYMNRVLAYTFGYGGTEDIGPVQWAMDQFLASFLLQQNQTILQGLQLVSRNTTADRIDRTAWPPGSWPEKRLSGYVDAHVLRPGYTPSNWALLQLLYKHMLHISDASSEDAQLWREIQQYQAEFLDAVQQTGSSGGYVMFDDSRKGIPEM